MPGASQPSQQPRDQQDSRWRQIKTAQRAGAATPAADAVCARCRRSRRAARPRRWPASRGRRSNSAKTSTGRQRRDRIRNDDGQQCADHDRRESGPTARVAVARWPCWLWLIITSLAVEMRSSGDGGAPDSERQRQPDAESGKGSEQRWKRQ
ncbi:hypothetical protein Scep_001563 [Stephania cephalantha]|uniref:Uncharacterized protein n=1 Tax=Stephania cephalantha TaxID=152367 RepID=A0AAP0Q3G9_9MAGN